MTNNDYTTLKLLDGVGHGVDHLHGSVVGWLVQKKDVRPHERDLGEHQTCA